MQTGYSGELDVAFGYRRRNTHQLVSCAHMHTYSGKLLGIQK